MSDIARQPAPKPEVDESVPQPAKSIRMQSIVVARGAAALFVVFHHAGRMAGQDRFFGQEAFAGIYDRFTGVNYFFVVSGFFVGWLSWKHIGEAGQSAKFFARRMARIYPLYWLILVPHIILYLLVPEAGADRQRDPVNILLSFFLLPYTEHPVYGVAWTLVQELLFCIVMAAVIALGRGWLWILPAWAVAIVAGHGLGIADSFPASYFLNGANFLFLMGVAVSRLLQTFAPPAPLAWAMAGTGLYLGFMLFGGGIAVPSFIDQCIYGVATSILLIGLVGMEQRRPIKFPAIMLAFGVASYSIYLIHPAFLSVATNIADRILDDTPVSVEIIVLCLAIAATAAAMVFDRFVEGPFTRHVSPVVARLLEAPFAAMAPGRKSSRA